MNALSRHLTLLIFNILLLGSGAFAQRVSFGLYAANGITLETIDNVLDFNAKKAVILAKDNVTIDKNDPYSAIIKISGRLDQDVTVTISTSGLNLNASHIPLFLRFAYYNSVVGTPPVSIIRSSAIELPNGFTSATFPLNKRASGGPAPPPTPNSAGIVKAQGDAYIVVYGTLGPVPDIPEIGSYNGDINIHVEYSTN